MRQVRRAAIALLLGLALLAPSAGAAEPAKPRDAAADSARIDELTKVMLDGEYLAKLKACGELRLVPRGSAAQEDLLLDRAFPACAAHAEWRLRAAAAQAMGWRYICGDREAPDPRAVALCVKLADDENAKVRHDAVYFGISNVREKSAEVIAALVRAATTPPTADDARNDVSGRVAESLDGVAPDKLFPLVEPYLKNLAKDPEPARRAYILFVKATKTEPPGAENMEGGGPFAVTARIEGAAGRDWDAAMALLREHVPAELVPVVFIDQRGDDADAYMLAADIKTRVAVIEKLKGVQHVKVNVDVNPVAPDDVARFTEWAKIPPAEMRKMGRMGPIQPGKLPIQPGEDLRQVLIHGDSARRQAIIAWAVHPGWLGHLADDEVGIDAMEACASDPDPKVRETMAILIGRLVWNREKQHPRGVALAIKLAADPEPGVSNQAIYYGLSTVKSPMSDEVLRAVAETAVRRRPFEEQLHGRLAWGLRDETPERLAPFFAPHLADPDKERALAAYTLFVHATGQEPPNAERFATEAVFVLTFGASRDSKHKTPKALLTAFRAYVREAKMPEVVVYAYEKQVQGMVVSRDLPALREVIATLNDDPELFAEPRAAVLGPARRAGLRVLVARDPARTISTVNVPPVTYDEVLRELHTHLGRSYASFAIKGIDWQKVGDELLPLAKDVRTDADFGLLCARMVARLEDSHAQLLPGAAPLPAIEFPRFEPGFACLIDDRDRPVVYHVDKGSPADAGGVKVGMAVVSVNGKPAAEAMAAWMEQQKTYAGYSSERYLRYDAARGFCRQMKQGEVVKLEMEDVEGKPHAFELTATLGVRYLPRLPAPIEGIDDSGNVESKKLADDIGYIYVRRIRGDLPQRLDAALTALGDIKGLVIDVRGNSGGGFHARAAVRNFNADDPAEPDRPRYKGPIALLVDERCISAGEGWASWFVATKRATSFGTATAGASARKDTYTLTNGLYKVVVPVKAYTGSLDRPIERRGLEPDVPVRCNAEDLAEGKDTILEAARAHLLNGLKQ